MADRMAMLEKLGNAFAEEQAEVLSEVIFNAYNELVRRADFNELKDVVRDLAEAQSRTEERVGALAEAQGRTEMRVEELAEAQGRTEKRVEELAEAQQRTEYAVQQLAQQVGGLSNRMGGDLEDIAADLIHDSLQRELGWQVDGLGRAWQSWDGTLGRGRSEIQPDYAGFRTFRASVGARRPASGRRNCANLLLLSHKARCAADRARSGS